MIVNAKAYKDAAWMPAPLSSVRLATVDLMLLPQDGHLNFGNATWKVLRSFRPRFAEILSTGISDGTARYAALMEQPDGLVLGSVLNLLTAMSQITLPSKKAPLGYDWQPIKRQRLGTVSGFLELRLWMLSELPTMRTREWLSEVVKPRTAFLFTLSAYA